MDQREGRQERKRGTKSYRLMRKSGAFEMPRLCTFPKVVVADRSVVTTAAKTASFESIVRSRKDIDHCDRVFPSAPYFRARTDVLVLPRSPKRNPFGACWLLQKQSNSLCLFRMTVPPLNRKPLRAICRVEVRIYKKPLSDACAV